MTTREKLLQFVANYCMHEPHGYFNDHQAAMALFNAGFLPSQLEQLNFPGSGELQERVDRVLYEM